VIETVAILQLGDVLRGLGNDRRHLGSGLID